MSDYLADTFSTTPEWMLNPDRNCASGHPDEWFPSSVRPLGLRPEVYAQQLCEGCPVVNACGEWAVPQPELLGIWGGLTEGSRKKLRNGKPLRDPRECANGHIRTPANTYTHATRGYKRCRDCDRDQQARRRNGAAA